MPVIAIINPKGGVGKSTIATNMAGYWAAQGHAVMLGDVDKQQSSRLWLAQRPAHLPRIVSWEMQEGHKLKAPKGVTHVVLDTPAGLEGKALKEVLRLADKVLVPLQPSVFDMFATRALLDALASYKKLARLDVALVGMRVKDHTLSLQHLQQFCAALPFPLLGALRDTQNYVHLAAQGLTLFDVTPGRVQRDLEQWQPLCRWMDAPGALQPPVPTAAPPDAPDAPDAWY